MLKCCDGLGEGSRLKMCGLVGLRGEVNSEVNEGMGEEEIVGGRQGS